jgi:hypothetical protein
LLHFFFFCFPPPDFAGFDDGGGAFSFFGAYTNQRKKEFNWICEEKRIVVKI